MLAGLVVADIGVGNVGGLATRESSEVRGSPDEPRPLEGLSRPCEGKPDIESALVLLREDGGEFVGEKGP